MSLNPHAYETVVDALYATLTTPDETLVARLSEGYVVAGLGNRMNVTDALYAIAQSIGYVARSLERLADATERLADQQDHADA